MAGPFKLSPPQLPQCPLGVEPGHGLAAMNRTFGDLPETGLHE
jgi:hypothetical protein